MKKLLFVSTVLLTMVLSGCGGPTVSADRFDCLTNVVTGETISLQQTKEQIDNTIGEGEHDYDNEYDYGTDLGIGYVGGKVEYAMVFDNWAFGGINFDMTREEIETQFGEPYGVYEDDEDTVFYAINSDGSLGLTENAPAFVAILNYGYENTISYYTIYQYDMMLEE